MISSQMWDSEVERIGMRDCTPVGYMLRSTADPVGVLGTMAIVAGVCATFILGKTAMIVLLMVGVGLCAFAGVLGGIAWCLVRARRFQYDADLRRATWIRRGARHFLTPQDIPNRQN